MEKLIMYLIALTGFVIFVAVMWPYIWGYFVGIGLFAVIGLFTSKGETP